MNFSISESTDLKFSEYINAFGNIMGVGGKYCNNEYLKDLNLVGIIPYMGSTFYVVNHGDEEAVIKYDPSKPDSRIITRGRVGSTFNSNICGKYTGMESTRPSKPIGGYYGNHRNHPIFG